MLAQVEQVPIIQTRAAHGLLIHVKGNGTHHMEPATRDHGGSPRIARVVGNLRMNQDNVEQWIELRIIHVERAGCGWKAWTQSFDIAEYCTVRKTMRPDWN